MTCCSMSTNTPNTRESLLRDAAALERIDLELASAVRVRDSYAHALRDAQAGLDLAELQWQHLMAQRRVLEQSISERRALVSAVHALPEEIIGEIFTHAMPPISIPDDLPLDVDIEAMVEDGSIDWDCSLLPLRLSMVSKHWQAIARSTKEMWTYVVVPAHAWLLDNDRFVCHIERMLRLSKDCLLDVVVESEDALRDVAQQPGDRGYDKIFAEKVEGQNRFFWRIFRLLYAHSHRIRTLHVYGSVNSCTYELSGGTIIAAPSTPEDLRVLTMGFLQLPTPVLQEARLLFYNGDSDDGIWDDGDAVFLPAAPRLQRLQVAHAYISMQHSLPSLESFILRNDSIFHDDIWKSLSACPALDELALGLQKIRRRHPPLQSQPPTSIPIRTLTLDGGSTWELFDGVALPRLQTLSIPNEVMPDFTPLAHIPTLRTLVIGDGGFWNLEEYQTPALQHVEHVTLVGGDNDVTPLCNLLCREPNPLWPRLKSFCIDVTDPALHRGDWVVRFVDNRLTRAAAPNSAVAPLERVALPGNVYAAWVVARLEQLLGKDNVDVFESERFGG
ncbi:hypothetical protein AURDEDRAFT_186666 [Auricularia subglabra TFB-10046 SS5]|nr:hypothetical protein AURDEDRAFT_186666 [Auricularia subglabra TFB-10046 SS5]